MRKIISYGVVLFCSLFFVKTSLATDLPFKETAAVTYELESSNTIKATFDIKITNLKTESYAPSLHLSTDGFSPETLVAYEGGIPSTVKSDKPGSYDIIFKKPVVGKGSVKHVVITFTDSSLVTANDQITRVHIPIFPSIDAFSTFDVSLKVPTNIAQNSSIAPTPWSESEAKNYKIYSFSKQNLISPINADFGQWEDYSFTMSYPPDNMTPKNGSYTFVIPSTTSYQQVLLTSISVKPNNIVPDADGNWIAIYNSKPKDTVVLKGKVRLLEEPTTGIDSLSEANRKIFLSESPYWQVHDPTIASYAQKLKTPEAIYNFVVSTLSYDYAKTNRSATRLGAVNALRNPTTAICMEFTDLFISLSRAAGIPAREVNGYAYTTNPTLQPLSLVSDILHAWPEYWDDTRKVWISVDPTWGSTTHGVDYFHKFDTNHFAFVVRGVNATSPVTPGTLSATNTPLKLIDVKQESGFDSKELYNLSLHAVGFINQKLAITVTNNGNVELPAAGLTMKSTTGTETISVPVVPPYSYVDLISSKTYRNGTVTYLNKTQAVSVPILHSISGVVILVTLAIIGLSSVFLVKYLYEKHPFPRRGKTSS